MSFASQAREEIVRRRIRKACCVRAACYGVACFSKYFDARGLVLQTEQRPTAEYAERLFACCGVQGTIEEKTRASGVLYEFAIRDEKQVAQMHALFGTTGHETNLQIDPALLPCKNCVGSYAASAFLCGGTVTDPQKGYNLEFVTPRTNLSRDFEALLAEHEFAPHRTRRKSVNLVYVKTGEHVAELLAFMGAEEAAAHLRDERAVKNVRNRINRQTNCDTANMSKTARANAETLKAIRYLRQCGALDGLPAPLREAAEKRLEYPDLSLAALGKCFEPEVSKSGLSHRMKKLEALAQDLRARNEQARQEPAGPQQNGNEASR
jgi:hypothetical protein